MLVDSKEKVLCRQYTSPITWTVLQAYSLECWRVWSIYGYMRHVWITVSLCNHLTNVHVGCTFADSYLRIYNGIMISRKVLIGLYIFDIAYIQGLSQRGTGPRQTNREENLENSTPKKRKNRDENRENRERKNWGSSPCGRPIAYMYTMQGTPYISCLAEQFATEISTIATQNWHFLPLDAM